MATDAMQVSGHGRSSSISSLIRGTFKRKRSPSSLGNISLSGLRNKPSSRLRSRVIGKTILLKHDDPAVHPVAENNGVPTWLLTPIVSASEGSDPVEATGPMPSTTTASRHRNINSNVGSTSNNLAGLEKPLRPSRRASAGRRGAVFPPCHRATKSAQAAKMCSKSIALQPQAVHPSKAVNLGSSSRGAANDKTANEHLTKSPYPPRKESFTEKRRTSPRGEARLKPPAPPKLAIKTHGLNPSEGHAIPILGDRPSRRASSILLPIEQTPQIVPSETEMTITICHKPSMDDERPPVPPKSPRHMPKANRARRSMIDASSKTLHTSPRAGASTATGFYNIDSIGATATNVNSKSSQTSPRAGASTSTGFYHIDSASARATNLNSKSPQTSPRAGASTATGFYNIDSASPTTTNLSSATTVMGMLSRQTSLDTLKTPHKSSFWEKTIHRTPSVPLLTDLAKAAYADSGPGKPSGAEQRRLKHFSMNSSTLLFGDTKVEKVGDNFARQRSAFEAVSRDNELIQLGNLGLSQDSGSFSRQIGFGDLVSREAPDYMQVRELSALSLKRWPLLGSVRARKRTT